MKKVKWNNLTASGVYQKNYPNVGTFLTWGLKNGNSVAIVQGDDNKVIILELDKDPIQFFDNEPKSKR